MEWYLKVIKNYATFSGRARRKEYWMFILVNFIIGIVLSILDNIFGMTYEYNMYPEYGSSTISSIGALSSVYNVFILIPSLAVTIRRLHDVNKSGWLIGFMYIGIAIFMLLIFSLIGSENVGLMVGVSLFSGLSMLGYGIYLLVLTVTEGTSGPNQYGEDPKELERLPIENNYTS